MNQRAQVVLTVEKSTGWVCLEDNYDDGAKPPRGFKKVEATRVQQFMERYDRNGVRTIYGVPGTDYYIIDGQEFKRQPDGGFYIQKG